ncbi:hypothetical protein P3L10_016305 [Capsicum annuum]
MCIYKLMQSNTVAYDEGRDLELMKKLFLGDDLSDIPSENAATASPLSLCLILLTLSIPVYDGRISNVPTYRNTPHALFSIALSESNTVAYDEGRDLELKKELFLGDALSDLPSFMMEESPISPLIGILLMLYLPLLEVRIYLILKKGTWFNVDSDCSKKIKEFVAKGFKENILLLPGDVDVVCGEPPCQGISGFNRFRNKENPMQDSTFLGMNYQARVGMMAAGAYGLPQFRMRVFMFGALSSEKLPQYPLPTYKVIVRGVICTEFESNTVVYDEGGILS